MSYVRKHYRSTDSKTNRHQKRGGGMTTRLSAKKNYPKIPYETVISPTFIKAREAKKLDVKTLKPLNK